MSRKNKIVVSITGITIVMLALLGITYAYYLTRIEGNTNTNSISITTADLKLSYSDGNGIVEKANFMPGDSITKTFTVENTGENKVQGYTIVLEDVVNELSRREDLKYSLYCTLDNGDSCGKSENNLYPKTKNIAIIYANDIDSGIKHNYELIVNYIYLETIDQSDDMGSNISGRVNIYDAKDDKLNPFKTGVSANDNKSLAYNIIENARLGKNGTTLTGTSLSNIGTSPSGKVYGEVSRYSRMRISDESISYYWTYAEGYILDSKNGLTLTGVKTCKYSECYEQLIGKYIMSTDLSEISDIENIKKEKTLIKNIYRIEEIGSIESRTLILTNIEATNIEINENILTTSIDDYGITYYYRGGVIDNYVNFAGMCWKVVRILGDGTIRMILEDKNVECSNETYTGDWSLGEGSFGYYIDEFNNNIMYPINSNDSYISNIFKEFQKQKLEYYLDKLAYGNWCYDNTTYSDENGENILTDLYSYYSSGQDFYYGSYSRIQKKIKPSLKCMTNMYETYEQINSEIENKIYVGTLTADEIIFAGTTDSNYPRNFYLKDNFNKSWWTISPDGFLSLKEGAFIMSETATLDNVEISENHHYRPAINLKKDTKISSGDGTKTNPYVIE